MSEETQVEAVEEAVETQEAAPEAAPEPTIEELKALAEAKEAELKEIKKVQEADEIRQNYLRRIEKVESKLAKATETLNPTQTEVKTESSLAIEDILDLRDAGIDRTSEKAEAVQRYIQSGLVKNAREALEHPGVKGEFEAIEAKNRVATTIDENDNDEVVAQSKREIVENYRAGNDVSPEDRKAIELIAADNVKNDKF